MVAEHCNTAQGKDVEYFKRVVYREAMFGYGSGVLHKRAVCREATIGCVVVYILQLDVLAPKKPHAKQAWKGREESEKLA